MIKALLVTLAAMCLALVAFSHLGGLHPIADTLSIVAPILAALAVGFALCVNGWFGGGVASVAVLWLAVWGHQVMRTSGPAGDFLLYQKNLWYRNTELEALAADIIGTGADAVTLQEVSTRNVGLLDLLRPTYPHQHLCPFSRWSGIAVVSAHPFQAGSAICSSARGLAAAELLRDGARITVASIHLPWPYPYNQAERLTLIQPKLRALQRPVVVGADLNMFPRTRVTRRIARLTGTRELRQVLPTLHLNGVPMYLDHILAPGGQVERRPKLGSDHFGLLGRLALSPR